MAGIPDFLSDEKLEKIDALGREMDAFLRDRWEQKQIDPTVAVEPGPQLLKMIADLKESHKSVSGR